MGANDMHNEEEEGGETLEKKERTGEVSKKSFARGGHIIRVTANAIILAIYSAMGHRREYSMGYISSPT